MIANLLALLDDITVMTKLAAKKTAGVLGDDLALNAQQVTGVKPERELPVVWAVAKGSARNKVILVPAALLISSIIPWAIVPLLMLGGLFLCYEGFEKVFHKYVHSNKEDAVHHERLAQALTEPSPSIDLITLEQDKIKGAIRTDFILSAEIIVISLGTVATASFGMQVAVLVAISVLMTVGVYGLVAGIVKLDDAGVRLSRKNAPWNTLGHAILWAAPWLMWTLSVVGTAAMFLVGGGILAHGIPAVDKWIASLAQSAGVFGGMIPMLLQGILGICAGAVVVAVLKAVGQLRLILATPADK